MTKKLTVPNMGTKKNSIADALFSQAQQRVLGLLFSQPNNDFYTKEIIRLSSCGTGAVQRELKKLLSAGLVTIKKSGNQQRYQANPSSPIFKELNSIATKTFGLVNIIKDAIKPVADQIDIAFIYGSFAKQEDNTNSDIDVMLITKDLTYAELFPLLEKAENRLQRTINPTFYSPSEWIRKRKNNNHFIKQISEQSKIFLIGTIDELEKLK